MIQKIRKSRISRVIASYLAIQMITTVVQPSNLWALTSGPSQPEFNAFTPIGTSDMVNLSSGDFNYNIPIMDVGGYPINLAYDSGVTMDQEASWVGLGWNLNIGQINRQVRGIPDDFKGDEMTYENDMKTNVTIGSTFGIRGSIFGIPDGDNENGGNDNGDGGGGDGDGGDGDGDGGTGIRGNASLGVQYNNYEGITFHPSFGVSFGLSDIAQAGMNFSSSTTSGASVTPRVSFDQKISSEKGKERFLSPGIGVPLNSRKGLEALTLSASTKKPGEDKEKKKLVGDGGSGSATLSFNNIHNYTPTKRAGMVNGNYVFNAAIGTEVIGVEVQGHVTGYGSYQKIQEAEKVKSVPAYGYDYSEYADKGNSIMDFTREKDRTFTKNTTVLPVPNNTYDIYSINGQGLSGMFRPHRGQVSYLADNTVQDYGDGVSLGLEFGSGWNVHLGADTEISPSSSHTKQWTSRNFALNRLEENSGELNSALYEQTYYKLVGEMNVDSEPTMYSDDLHSNAPMNYTLASSSTLEASFRVKQYNNEVPSYSTNNPISSKFKRSHRNRRNTAIYKVTAEEAINDPLVSNRDGWKDSRIKNDHTAGIKILKPDGSTYVFGETSYNWEKQEITVDVSGASNDCKEGTVVNDGGVNPLNGSDEYFSNTRTPAYAHTFLLSSVLSSDYEDLTGDGPSKDDLGAYTLFKYGDVNDLDRYVSSYEWKTPYGINTASFNEGLKSHGADQKGNIIKGSKELRYIKTIETKTHVSYFVLSDRRDSKSAGNGGDLMRKIDKIYLFTQPEYQQLLTDNNTNDPDDVALADLQSSSIKTAHFEYDYDLCRNIPNHLEFNGTTGPGKLTLKKLYFTYRGSHMGKYTPYLFNYEKDSNGNGQIDPEEEYPGYSLKGYDIWGNYKDNSLGDCAPTNPNLITSEFPFVEQDKDLADKNSSAWTLTSIDLPSGGKIEIETEADDYGYVQDRKAMQMFKISGFTDDEGSATNPFNTSEFLYNGSDHKEYVNVKISDENLGANYLEQNFKDDYLSENLDNPIYFRSLLQMVHNQNDKYDYVEGYFKIDQSKPIFIGGNANGTYAAIPMVMLEREGGWIEDTAPVNPITKAGWYFGRTNLNRIVYSMGGDYTNDDFLSIVGDLVGSLGNVFDIFSGPNLELQNQLCARKSSLDKSWIRLENPDGRKFGGGLRVKEIKMWDNWDNMDEDPTNDGSSYYSQFYGQQYEYNHDDGTSSGVATYEPNGSKENPLVKPIYDRDDRLVAPKEMNYTEKPFGESFFPSPMVTYAKVTVKNLERENGQVVLKKHATGKVVNEFFTTRNFPTITDYTDISAAHDPQSNLSGILNLDVKEHLAYSQGFVVETNDINGRPKSQFVYAEGHDSPISGVEYIYNANGNRLSNQVVTIDKSGVVSQDLEVGMTYDLFSDFRENYSQSTVAGVNGNVAAFMITIWPAIIPTAVPEMARHETRLRTAANVKVIHRSAILKEKIAHDLGSSVSTQNLAWDAHTGQVILTKTINEYDDNYFNFSYPSHWYYKGMDMAVNNIGMEGVLSKGENAHSYTITGEDISQYLFPGDELMAQHVGNEHPLHGSYERLWVASISPNIVLIDKDGNLSSDECAAEDLYFKVVRSGHRNLQSGSMASVTSMINPINVEFNPDPQGNDLLNDIGESSYLYLDGVGVDPRIVNASAVEYRDAWIPQKEMGLPGFPDALVSDFEGIDYSNPQTDNIAPEAYGFNPYLYNVRGDWRANKSYAYLTSRSASGAEGVSPRYKGFFGEFNPFYKRSASTWEINNNNWTFASEVTNYSPFGAELENKDALDRYSSAQYGYNYTLPVAVASNASYDQMGFDGFEDYGYQGTNNPGDKPHFGWYTGTSGSVSLDDQVAHTGRNSIKVTGETSLLRDYTNQCTNEVTYSIPNCNTGSPIIVGSGGSNACVSCFSVHLNVDPGKSYTVEVEYILATGGSGADDTTSGCHLSNSIWVSSSQSPYMEQGVQQTTNYTFGLEGHQGSNNINQSSIIFKVTDEQTGEEFTEIFTRDHDSAGC